jgi:hypothetical protein
MYDGTKGAHTERAQIDGGGADGGVGGMFLEGMTVCVDYADFLDVTLTENLDHFDEFVVVTSTTDRATQGVCAKHGVTCVKTDVYAEDPLDKFNKGLMINMGLAHLRHRGWVVHMDADVVLPDRMRFMLNKSRLDIDSIYGVDRVNVLGRELWEKLKTDREYIRQYHHYFMVNAPKAPLGARLVHNEFGYAPLGYFQLWNSKYNRRRYHSSQGSAEHTDVLFALQWPANKRILLPGMFVYHLESESSKMGQNWKGRTTKRF